MMYSACANVTAQLGLFGSVPILVMSLPTDSSKALYAVPTRSHALSVVSISTLGISPDVPFVGCISDIAWSSSDIAPLTSAKDTSQATGGLTPGCGFGVPVDPPGNKPCNEEIVLFIMLRGSWVGS